jgi:hypothetical protein
MRDSCATMGDMGKEEGGGGRGGRLPYVGRRILKDGI